MYGGQGKGLNGGTSGKCSSLPQKWAAHTVGQDAQLPCKAMSQPSLIADNLQFRTKCQTLFQKLRTSVWQKHNWGKDDSDTLEKHLEIKQFWVAAFWVCAHYSFAVFSE